MIRDSKYLFGSAERAAAEYLLGNVESVVNMPISILAERSNVSRATWIRLAKRMGFQGLKELKREIVTQIRSNSEPQQRTVNFSDIENFDATSSIFRNIAALSITSIENTLRLLNCSVLEQAADLIIGARRLCVSGVGASGIVALDLHTKLMRIGINSIYSMDFHFQMTAVSGLEPGDVMLAFSHSGQTNEVIELCRLAKERGAVLVAVTHYGKNPVSAIADFALFTSTPEPKMRSGAVGSRTAQLLIADCLYMSVTKKSYAGVKEKLLKSYIEAGKHKNGIGSKGR